MTEPSPDPTFPYERPPLSKDFRHGETDDVALEQRSWFAERDIELVQGVALIRRRYRASAEETSAIHLT